MGHHIARLTLLLGSWHVFLWCCQTAFTGPSRAESRSSSACTLCRVRERRKTARGKGLDKQLNPQQITLRITQAASASEVLGVVREQQRNPKLDFIAVSAAWHKMANLQHSVSAEVLRDSFLMEFVGLTGQMAVRAQAEANRNARAVASIYWAVVQLEPYMSSQLKSLQASLGAAAKKTAAHMKAQEVANTIWAAAKLSETGDISLLVALPSLVERVKEVKSEMKAQEVSNVIWAAAKLSEVEADDSLLAVLPALAERVQEVILAMKAQEVSNSIWATAKLRESGDDSLLLVLPVLVERAKSVRPQMIPQHITMTRWAVEVFSHDARLADTVQTLQMLLPQSR
ncbi:unnamed protein product [Effrenium voratum]|nr:unnamed protein product [Effrenium voratum]